MASEQYNLFFSLQSDLRSFFNLNSIYELNNNLIYIKLEENYFTLEFENIPFYIGYYSIIYGSGFFSGIQSIFPYNPVNNKGYIFQIKKYSTPSDNLNFGYAIKRNSNTFSFLFYRSFDNVNLYKNREYNIYKSINDYQPDKELKDSFVKNIFNTYDIIGICFQFYNLDPFILNFSFSYNIKEIETNDVNFDKYGKFEFYSGMKNENFELILEPVCYFFNKYNYWFYDINGYFKIYYQNNFNRIMFEGIYKDVSEKSLNYFKYNKALSITHIIEIKSIFPDIKNYFYSFSSNLIYYYDPDYFELKRNIIFKNVEIEVYDTFNYNHFIQNPILFFLESGFTFFYHLIYKLYSIIFFKPYTPVFDEIFKVKFIYLGLKKIKIINTFDFDFKNHYFYTFYIVFKNDFLKTSVRFFKNNFNQNKILIQDKIVKNDFDIKYVYPYSSGIALLVGFYLDKIESYFLSIKFIEKKNETIDKKKKRKNIFYKGILYFKFYSSFIDNKLTSELTLGFNFSF